MAATQAGAQTAPTASDWVPPSHLLHKDVMLVWAAEVEKATQGRVKVNFLPSIRRRPRAPSTRCATA
jgi:TRAP-type C4-dicarboxylate transport system substrate-binding protein